MPGIATGVAVTTAFNSSCAGTSDSAEFNACYHVTFSPVLATMRRMIAVKR